MTAFLVASILGAALFFIAGGVAMSLRAARRPAAGGADVAGLQQELSRTRSAFDHERVAAELTRSELAQVRVQLESVEAQRSRTDRVEIDRDAQKMRADRLEAERKAEYARADRAEAERNAQQARAERAEAALRERAEAAVRGGALGERTDVERTNVVLNERTVVDVAAAHARADRAESELEAQSIRSRAELDLLKTRLERAESDRDAMAMRMTELRDELERTRADVTAFAVDGDRATSRLAELQQNLAEKAQTVRDLATENEQLKGRLRDAEGLRADYVRLRTAIVETEFLKSEVARLERELRSVRVDALAGAKTPAAPARSGRVTGLQATSPAGTRTISESLLGVLDRFADTGTRSLAIADLIGFPLASTGADAQALAAYATLLAEAAGRSDQFLPVARPVSIEVVDERGARLSVWPFDVDGDRLLLANLSVAPVEKARVDATLAALAKILAPSAIAS